MPEEILKLPLHVRAELAMREALAEVIADHKRRGAPLAVSRNGQVVWVSAEELERDQRKEEAVRLLRTLAVEMNGTSSPDPKD